MSRSVLPYYKRYTRDLLDGTVGLGFEDKTVYAFILDLIYHHDGKLPDESRYISGHLECSVRKWNNIKSSLVKKGKLEIIDGFIRNYRADKEVISRRKYQDKQAEKSKKPRPRCDSGETTAKQSEEETEPDTDISSSLLVRGRDDKAIRHVCVEAAKPVLHPEALAMIPIQPILNLMDDECPCDLERDILPAFREIAARGSPNNMRQWSYLIKVAVGYRDARLAGNPKPQTPKAQNGKQHYSPTKQKSSVGEIGEARRNISRRILERNKTKGMAS